MERKLIFAAFLLAYGIWLVSHPARTAGLNEWAGLHDHQRPRLHSEASSIVP